MDIAYVHFYVQDITQAVTWFKQKMGLISLDNWVKDSIVTELVGNNALLFVISAPLDSLSPVADYLKIHPPGVADIAFRVKDLVSFSNQINSLGIKVIETYASNGEDLESLKIQGWGSLTHTIIQDFSLERLRNILVEPELGIIGIDHLVLNVPLEDFDSAISWYKNLFNWNIQQTFNIKTCRSGLHSVALIDEQKKIRFNINQPTSVNSQIQEFLDFNQGAGIQHIALRSDNIFESVNQLKKRGVSFLDTPKTYYNQLSQRYQGIVPTLGKKEWQLLENEQILLDWTKDNPESMLMQIFTQPIFNQPTFFFEIIERKGEMQGFGEGNFQSLFEALEKEQISRRQYKAHILN
jgi:4-hydroxyphenylpyruvate dioxygenase